VVAELVRDLRNRVCKPKLGTRKLLPLINDQLEKQGLRVGRDPLFHIMDGYGTSFLEESFGGLIRNDKIDYNEIINRLEIISNEEEYIKEDVYEYIKDAHNEASN